MAYRIPRSLVGLIGATLLVSACTTKSQETPPLTGPSELSTAIAIAASPDVIAQDGASQSLITITAHDANGQLLRNLPLRVEIAVDGAVTDFGSLSARNVVTDSTGRAFVTYTAPPTPPIFVDAGTMVQIRVLPAGTNADNGNARFASIRLVPPGVIGAPPSPFRPSIVVQGSPTVGDQTVFSASVTDSNGADVTNQIASYAWSFGDGDTASGRTVSHTFDDPGTVSVSLTITDALGRRATVSQAVNVAPGNNPDAVFTVTPSSPNIGQNVTFNASQSTATAGHRITNFSWDFGDGTGAGGPIVTHAYAANGSYSVTLTVTDDAGRTKVAVQPVTVGPGAPTALFTFSPSSPQTNQPVSFDASASSATAGRSIVSYAWSFDDGFNGSGVTTSHTYAIARTYTVRLTVTDSAGQTGTTTQSVTVGSGNPTAAFTFSPSSPLAGSTVTFDASTSQPGVSRTIVSYRWNFDDGSAVVVSATPTTTHSFATGTYQVLLTVTDDVGQTGQTTRTVSVGSGTPTSSFTFSPTNPSTGQAVLYDGRSSTAVSGRTITGFAWTFGDGGTATGPTPTHTYTATGTFVIRLTVTDSAGQSAASTQNITVTSDPTAQFTFAPPAPTAGSNVSFDGSPSSAGPGRSISTYSWNFGDPSSGPLNTTTGQFPNHQFLVAGSYNVTLTVTDSAGRTGTATRTVIVSP